MTYFVDTESQIKKFEKMFNEVVLEAQTQAEQLHDTDILTDSSSSSWGSFAVIMKRRYPFSNAQQFFQYLTSNCCNFLEYKVLQNLIECRYSQTLEPKMSEYARDIEKFKQRVTIMEFILYGSHLLKNRSLPSHFKIMILEYNIDPNIHRLVELDAFRKDTLEGLCLKLSESDLQVYRIKHGSVIVEWMIAEDFVGYLSDLFSSEVGQKILHKHRVEKLEISNKPVPIQSVSYFYFIIMIIHLGPYMPSLFPVPEIFANCCKGWEFT